MDKFTVIQNTDQLKANNNVSNQSFSVKGKGNNSGELYGGVLAPGGGSIIIDGKEGTEGIIPGIDNITLESSSGVLYDYTLRVVGKCPSGKWDNHMTFTDKSPDTYHLRIFSGTHKTHTVNYHSTNGVITKITWDI